MTVPVEPPSYDSVEPTELALIGPNVPPPSYEDVEPVERRGEDLVVVQVVTRSTMAQHLGFDIAAFDGNMFGQPESVLPTYHLPRESRVKGLLPMIGRDLDMSPKRSIRLHKFGRRQNGTMRVTCSLREVGLELETTTLGQLQTHAEGSSPPSTLRLYLEEENRSSYLGINEPFLVFVKEFSVATQSLHLHGHFVVGPSMKLYQLERMIRVKLGLPSGYPLSMYEEVKPGTIDQLPLKKSFKELGLGFGDIVCFQVEKPQQNGKLAWEPGWVDSLLAHYENMFQSIIVTFKPKVQLLGPPASPSSERLGEVEFDLPFKRDDPYETMVQAVARHLGVAPLVLRFTRAGSSGALDLVDRRANARVGELVRSVYNTGKQRDEFVLYYKVLDSSLSSGDGKKGKGKEV
ncbi:hypothetical protein T439DRAFT_379996 [Meredithblackwellia eburnea MCA 4105]